MKTQLIGKLLEKLIDDKEKTEPWNGSEIPFAVGKGREDD